MLESRDRRAALSLLKLLDVGHPARSGAISLGALVHGLELLLIDGQVVPGEYRKGIVHRVLQLAGAGLDGARA